VIATDLQHLDGFLRPLLEMICKFLGLTRLHLTMLKRMDLADTLEGEPDMTSPLLCWKPKGSPSNIPHGAYQSVFVLLKNMKIAHDVPARNVLSDKRHVMLVSFA
jgi:hypothetical protein